MCVKLPAFEAILHVDETLQSLISIRHLESDTFLQCQPTTYDQASNDSVIQITIKALELPFFQTKQPYVSSKLLNYN